jgi:hypothetical protein
MTDTLKIALAGWTDFYLITGTAAATLTGLQFVVQTLLASDTLRHVTTGDPETSIDAFGTPTVVHFTMALIVSAMMNVPWPGYGSLRVSLGILAVVALGYSIVVLRRTLQQRSYVPVFEDWLWHIALPGAAYVAVLVCALFFGRGEAWELFAVAAATVVLLCVGIHNAWDTVTYLTIRAVRSDVPVSKPPQPKRNDQRARGKSRR